MAFLGEEQEKLMVMIAKHIVNDLLLMMDGKRLRFRSGVL